MRIRALGCALASAACLLLTACSHPQLMDPGMTESQVRTELGAPHAAVDTGKGTQRWVYSMQPFGQEVWWIEFDADGR
ncbi:MAG: outer membrane protein assembly factor BamE, partial [Clostridiales bacterium]